MDGRASDFLVASVATFKLCPRRRIQMTDQIRRDDVRSRAPFCSRAVRRIDEISSANELRSVSLQHEHVAGPAPVRRETDGDETCPGATDAGMIALERQTEIIGVGITALYRHRSEEADRQTPNRG